MNLEKSQAIIKYVYPIFHSMLKHIPNIVLQFSSISKKIEMGHINYFYQL